MPIDFLAFTSDRRISGRIMLADDRLSDMLNAVTRLVIRDATVDELADDRSPRLADVTIAIGEMLVVVGTGPRGSEQLRKKWLKRRAVRSRRRSGSVSPWLPRGRPRPAPA